MKNKRFMLMLLNDSRIFKLPKNILALTPNNVYIKLFTTQNQYIMCPPSPKRKIEKQKKRKITVHCQITFLAESQFKHQQRITKRKINMQSSTHQIRFNPSIGYSVAPILLIEDVSWCPTRH